MVLTHCSGSWACDSKGGKLSIGKIWDFSQLILSPENDPNCSIVWSAVWRERPESAKYNNVSSVYILIFSVRDPKHSPRISGFSRIDIARDSAARAYSSGNKGQPCLVPLVRSNTGDGHPLATTLAVGVWYNS